jgi:hypothetical protein
MQHQDVVIPVLPNNTLTETSVKAGAHCTPAPLQITWKSSRQHTPEATTILCLFISLESPLHYPPKSLMCIQLLALWFLTLLD